MTSIGRTHRSWRSVLLSFDDAVQRHRMIAKTYELWVERKPTCSLDDVPRALWHSLVGIQSDRRMDEICWVWPPEVLSTLARSDCVPAAFAFCAILKCFMISGCADALVRRNALRQALEYFHMRRMAANDIAEGYGCDESMAWHTLRNIVDQSHDDVLLSKLIQIARLAGCMFEEMRSQQKVVKRGIPQQVDSATVGGDISRLMPSELARLGIDNMKDQSMMRILKGSAQQRQMTGLVSSSRGPMVLVIDSSSSMHDEHQSRPGRNSWAKAAAVALTRMAWREGREVRAVHFSSGAVVQQIEKGDVDGLFELSRSYLGGGTHFSSAINTAKAEIDSMTRAGIHGADVVMITDGQDDRNFIAHSVAIDGLDDIGARLWTVGVGRQLQQQAPLRSRAARYVAVYDDDLGDEKTASALAARLTGAAVTKTRDDLLN